MAVLRWVGFLLVLGLSVYLSSRSYVPGAERVPDYVLHSIEFSALTLLLVNALSGGLAGPHAKGVLAAALGFGIGYGLLDEWHQSFVPGRDSSLRDAGVDAAATGATVLLLALRDRLRASGATRALPDTPRPETARRGEDDGSGVGEGNLSGQSSAASCGMRVGIVLLTRSGCHLCEDARGALVSALGEEGAGWRSVDISSDSSLEDQYGLEIPVVLIDGVKRFKGRVEPTRLRRLLAERSRLRSLDKAAGTEVPSPARNGSGG
jgi:VanZ family protein